MTSCEKNSFSSPVSHPWQVLACFPFSLLSLWPLHANIQAFFFQKLPSVMVAMASASVSSASLTTSVRCYSRASQSRSTAAMGAQQEGSVAGGHGGPRKAQFLLSLKKSQMTLGTGGGTGLTTCRAGWPLRATCHGQCCGQTHRSCSPVCSLQWV